MLLLFTCSGLVINLHRSPTNKAGLPSFPGRSPHAEKSYRVSWPGQLRQLGCGSPLFPAGFQVPNMEIYLDLLAVQAFQSSGH